MSSSPHAGRIASGRSPSALLVALVLALAGLGGLVTIATPAHAASGVDQGLGADFDPTDNAYTNQPDLTPDRVKSGFGSAWQFPTGGGSIGQVFARPVSAGGTLVVATEENVIYGVDPATGLEKWHTVLTSDGKPLATDSSNRDWYFDTSKPIVDNRTCGDISPHVGVTSTPTVGPDGTVYLVAKVGMTPKANGDQVARFEMHALDPKTGAEKTGWPVVLNTPADNAPGIGFEGAVQNQRAALLLQNGRVYVAFAAHCDLGLYRGWIYGVDTATATISASWTSETGPNHLPVSGVDDDGDDPSQLISPEGGIWQGGAPLVPDAAGTGFYFATGNGDFPTTATSAKTGTGALGNAVVHATVNAATGKISVPDFYIPNWAASLNKVDVDLGSGSPTLLPDSFGTTKYPKLLIVAGKSGDIWLLNANNLNGFKQGSTDPNAGGALSRINVFPGVVFGKIAVYDGPGDDHLIYVRVGETLRAYKVAADSSGIPRLTEVGRDAGGGVALGGSPLVTQVGSAAGSGIVWTEWEPNNDGTNSVLQAYAAVPDDSKKMTLLWEGSIGRAAKFQVPTVIGGWVYTAGRDGQVHAFHNPSSVPLTSVGGAIGKVVQGTSRGSTVTLTARQAVTVTSAALKSGSSTAFTLGTPSKPLPATLAAGESISIPFTFNSPSTASPSAGQVPGSGLGYAATIDVETNLGEVDVPLSGTAEYASGHLAVNALLALGDYPVGDDAAQPLTQNLVLTNDGATNLVVDSVDLPDDPLQTSGVPAAGTTIAPGGTVSIGVSFIAAEVGDYDSSFVFHWHPAGSTTVTDTETEVTASGVTPAHVDFSPAPPVGQPASVAAWLDFGDVPVGTPVTQTFTLTNTGGAAALFSISKIPTAPSLSFPNPIPEGFSLAGGASVSIPITWTPTAVGGLVDNWTVDVGSGVGKQTMHIIGNAVPAPVVTPTPTPTAAPTPVFPGGSAKPKVLKPLVALGSRGAWVWKGSVKRNNASTVTLGGLASDTYKTSLSSVVGTWTVTLPKAHDRLDVRYGTLTIRLQRNGSLVKATVYSGSRALTSGTQRLSPGGKVRLDLSVVDGVAKVSLQRHGLKVEKAPAAGAFGFYPSGTRSVTVSGTAASYV